MRFLHDNVNKIKLEIHNIINSLEETLDTMYDDLFKENKKIEIDLENLFEDFKQD
jgi:hypothetical protein